MPSLRIGFLLLDRFTLTAFSTFVDAIRLAADVGGRSRKIHCAWTIMGQGAIRASCGLRVRPDEPLGDPARFDYLAVCGGNGYRDRQLSRESSAFLQEAAVKGVRLIGVCTGTFALAEAGLLDGHRACVHWNVLDAFQEAYPAVEACSDQLFIESGERITCAGSVGGADLALHLIARHCGPEKAQQAARHMMLQGARPAHHPQPHCRAYQGHIEDAVVRRVILLMEQSMNEFRPVAWFAERVGVSVRQLERRFVRAVGMAPASMFRRMRLENARYLLEQTPMSVLEIAHGCGFSDSAHLVRDFKVYAGITPKAYRHAHRGGETTEPQEAVGSPAVLPVAG
ncbi:MAG: helix-turn-helix domain-containing protein [Rhizobiales bacterium]|nr:helix-turn-helix domain-containing protein [Hyphomicrobiales bacterium]